MYQHTTDEALRDVEQALEEYKEKLDFNIKIMIDAAEACDSAMGSDDLSKHYIGEMEKSIKILKRKSNEIDELRKDMQRKINQFDEIIENAMRSEGD